MTFLQYTCRTVLFIGIMMMFVSCAKTPQKQFYLISYVPKVAWVEGSARPYPFRVQLREFDVLRVYNRSPMVLRFSPNQIQYYNFKHWAVRPGYMITDAIEKHLKTANLIAELRRDFLDTRPDYQISGTVSAIERFDSGDMWYGHLAMSFKLIREKDRKEIWNYSFDRRKRVYNADVVYTVQALSEILDSEMQHVIRELDQIFYRIAQEEGLELSPAQHPAEREPYTATGSDNPTIRIFAPPATNPAGTPSGYEIIPAKREISQPDTTQ
ncbi:MAG: hypothetical protein D6675_08960 [Gemmatimonadetes bacterium]|nr:MAG: hypothetical protein D6675_08960 [Gemmatimonadota bacterium]